MIHRIDNELLDELKLFADYTHRQIKDSKALGVYIKAKLRGKIALADRIVEKYGRGIDRASRSDLAVSMAMMLQAAKQLPETNQSK